MPADALDKNPDEFKGDEDLRLRFEASLAEWRKRIAPLIKKIRDSERITAADLAVTINARDDDEI